MRKINHSELKKLLKLHYANKEPINFYGHPGIGKSWGIKETAQEIAAEKKKHFVEWRELTREEKIGFIESEQLRKDSFIFIDLRGTQLGDGSDLRGIINLIKQNHKNYVEWDTPMFITYMTMPFSDGILFLDERNLTNPMIQSSFYSILYDKCVGDVVFSKDWGIVSAGNLDLDRANTFSTPYPLRDRESEYELQPPTDDEFTDFMFKNGGDVRIISFIKSHPISLYQMDTKSGHKPSTPRGWFKLSSLIKDNTDTDEIEMIASGRVGEPSAILFEKFLKIGEEINIKQYLENPEMAEKIPENRIDLKYALCSNLAEYYKKNKTKDTLQKALVLSNHIETEFGVVMLRFVYAVDSQFFGLNAPKLKEWSIDTVEKFKKYLLG